MGPIPLTHTSLIMPKQNDAERSNANTGNTRRGIVRHSTFWLRPVLVGQFEFCGVDSRQDLRFILDLFVD